jgi:hypothetical protein
MDSPKKGYSRSEWTALSIQERIRAMNDTLDTVEASPANLGILEETVDVNNYTQTQSISSPVQSSMSETEDLAAAEAPAIPKRTSVVDMWRKREAASPNKTEVPESPVPSKSPMKSKSKLTAIIREQELSSKKQQEEKKEHQAEDSSHTDELPAPSAVRNMWSQRVANSPVPVSPKPVVAFPIGSSNKRNPVFGFAKPPLMSDEPADFTILPPAEEGEGSISAELDGMPKRSKVTNMWAQRGLQRVRTPSPHPSEVAAAAAQELASPTKRVSVVASWQNRKSPPQQQTVEDASTAAAPELASPYKLRGVNSWQSNGNGNSNNSQRSIQGVNSWQSHGNNNNSQRSIQSQIEQQESGDQQSFDQSASVDLSITAVSSNDSSRMHAPRRPKVVPAPIVPVPASASATNNSGIRAPSPKRLTAAERWARRRNEQRQESPSNAAAVAADDTSNTLSISTSPNHPDEALSEPGTDPTENTPAPAVALTRTVVPLPSPASRAASPRRSVADRWAKRVSDHHHEDIPKVAAPEDKKSSSPSHADEALSEPLEDPTENAQPAPIPYKLKPVKSYLDAAKSPEPLADPTEKLKPANRWGKREVSSPSTVPIERASPTFKRGKVADRWPLAGNQQHESKNAEEEEKLQPPTNALTSSIQQRKVDSPKHPAEQPSIEESVKPVAAKGGNNIPVAPLKPASLIPTWKSNAPKAGRPVKLAKPLELPKRNEAPKAQVDAALKDSSFESWSNGGKQADIDSDASSTASKSDPVARLNKKKNLMRMAQKHVKKGIAHKLAVSGSLAKDDDNSTQPGDLSTAVDSVATGSTATRYGAAPLASLVRKDVQEAGAAQEKEEVAMEDATLGSPLEVITPKLNPSPAKNLDPPVVVRIKSPKSSKLTIEPTADPTESVSWELDDDEEEEDELSPTTKKVVESLIQKKKRLQSQRRKVKMSRSSDSAGDQPASLNSSDIGYQQATPGGASEHKKGISSSSPLSSRYAGPERNDDLRPIDEDAADFAVRQSNENTFPSAYSPLRVPDSAQGVLSPKSEGGQSESAFSFYSAASSAHTGISRNSSGISSKGSSLANRAEKVLQVRRQKWKGAGTKDEKRRAKDLARKVLNGPQDVVSPQRKSGDDNYNYGAAASNSRREHDSSMDMEPSAARAQAKGAGLSTRYNTSSRFIDTDPSYGGAFAQPEPSGGRDHISFSTAESVDSSEFRSVGSATTESESEFRSARRRDKKKAAKYAREKARAKNNPESISNGVVSDQFVSESTANVEAFKTAYEAVSLVQIATDLADEVSLSVNGSGFDFQKIAIDVNDSIRQYCGLKRPDSRPCDGAADVDDIEDEDVDLGGCAGIDNPMEFSGPVKKSWENKPCIAPAGQPSFEGLAISNPKGVRAAYV